jgi:thiol-disulfide isomerase/thioredoxin
VWPFIKFLLQQLILILAVLIGMNYLQGRNSISGASPIAQLVDLKGGAFEFPAKDTNKVKIVYFFAPWCGVCRLSMGNLNVIQDYLPNVSVQVVALDYESREEVSQFVQDLNIRVPVAFGSESMRNAWRIQAYPSYFVLSRDNTIASSSLGYSSQLGMILRVLFVSWFH